MYPDWFVEAVGLTKAHAVRAVAEYRTPRTPPPAYVLSLDGDRMAVCRTLSELADEVKLLTLPTERERWTLTADLRWVSTLGRVMVAERV